jgi:DNA-binding CsgD family transcriptional regulator
MNTSSSAEAFRTQRISTARPTAASPARSETPQPPLRWPESEQEAATPHGLVLTDLTLKPLYANACATSILTFRTKGMPPAAGGSIASRLRAIFRTQPATAMAAVEFVSGSRRYIGHASLLYSHERAQPPVVAIELERSTPDHQPSSEIFRHFHLSPRECETVGYISQGLTTKEVAELMHLSPNTVKQFIRLIMTKMGVTTRSGIVGKLLAG